MYLGRGMAAWRPRGQARENNDAVGRSIHGGMLHSLSCAVQFMSDTGVDRPRGDGVSGAECVAVFADEVVEKMV